MTPHQAHEDRGPPSLDSADVGRMAASGALLLTLRGFGVRGLAFLGNAVLARLLVPHDFGILAFGLAIVAFGGFLVDSGLGAVLIRNDELPDRATLSSVLGFQLVAMLTVTAVVLTLGLITGRILTIAAVMTSGLSVVALRVPSTIVLERNLKYGLLALIDIADTVSFTVLSIGLVLTGLGVWGVAIAIATQGFLGTAIILLYGPMRRLWPTLHFSRIRRLLSFGVQYQATGLINLLRDEGTSLGVAAISGLGTLGIIALGGRLMLAVALVLDSLSRVSYPAMAQLRRLGSDPRGPLDTVSRYTGVVASGIIVAVAGVLPGSVTAVFGAKWHDVLVVLPGMLGGLLVVGPVTVACAGYLYAEGHASVVLKSAVAHTIAAWATISLLPVWGLPVISYGSFAVCVLEAVILGHATRRWSSWNVGRALARTWTIAGAVAAVAWITASSLPVSLIFSILTGVCAEVLLISGLLVFERPTVNGVISLVWARLPRSGRLRSRAA